MLRRLLLGLIKGSVIGIGLGLVFQLALGWSETGELLSYLLSMGTGASAGLLSGRPPWRQDSWLESLLKAVAGVGVGAMVYWVAFTYAPLALPFDLLGSPEGALWTVAPVLYLPPTATLFGALVELDNTPEDRSRSKPKAKARKKHAPTGVPASSPPPPTDSGIDWES